jgi:hypothetical protein
MVLRDTIHSVLHEAYGGFITRLETMYEERIINELSSDNMENNRKWITYNQVILELKHKNNNSLMVKKLLYELSEIDKINPNKICIDVLKEVKINSPELKRLHDKILKFN